ncbi:MULTISPECIES: MarR family winged helix-turn-helix transcriptional regulator [unclassified Lysobacter]|uniref:MarR family winged helix-turn-helix transcriptional regulator n=1 Tax=unclassified Lysobacter TaxID=2635362 RepID=UPI001BE884EA|nr:MULTISPECIES: MarR family winged helix-turn-helix transcriptional regulator [unclassified Lysobacter]MBT2747095.1 winged helix-turn-helix transcriptional regulator [Lysobacter sp. ISL-42]MBT2750444.1 winged helix-turn-helix transcriptional regulator [Lysobacter sp. ISL-50]MBT2776290.1 winged helix-turn-helix transcriptional regulator [Lysobacter sp. ISL-54]MBT2780785.1 winged helix-turn-helix transcriptional regulator [Lysobacter sp. ISL-52]
MSTINETIRAENAVPSVCTCFRMRKLARLMTQRYDQALAPAGVNLNQYSILRRTGGRGRPLGEVAHELGMDRSTLSRDLKSLVASGWIESVPGADARQRRLRITDSGRAVIERAQPLWRVVQDEIDRGLGHDGIEALHAQLDRAIVQLQADAASAQRGSR